jgi:hypothetical protein
MCYNAILGCVVTKRNRVSSTKFARSDVELRCRRELLKLWVKFLDSLTHDILLNYFWQERFPFTKFIFRRFRKTAKSDY